MATEKETVPDYRSALEGDNFNKFAHWMETRIALSAEIKSMEEQKKVIDENLTNLMTEVGVPKLQYGDRPVSITQGSRSSLSKEKLLLAGVTASVIQAATVETKYTYLLVGQAKV